MLKIRSPQLREFLLHYALFFALTVAAYWPVLTQDFAYHNDLGIWAYGAPGKDHQMHWESAHVIVVGRPLGAILLNIQAFMLRQVRGIENLIYFRIFTLAAFAFLMTLVDRRMLAAGFKNAFGRVAAIVFMFMHPSWLIATAWISSFVPSLLAYVAGLLAGWKIDRPEKMKPLDWTLSGGLLAFAFYLYPPGACAFFWNSAIQYFSGNRQSIKKVAVAIGFFGAVCAAALAAHYWAIKPLLCNGKYFFCSTWETTVQTGYSLSQSYDVLGKARALLDATQMWAGSWLYFGPGWLWVGPLIALVLFASIARRRLRDWAALIGVVGLLYLPNLITSVSVIGYRTTAPLTLLLAIGAAAGLSWILSKRPKAHLPAGLAVALGAILLTAVYTHRFVDYNARAWQAWLSTPEIEKKCEAGAHFLEFVGLAEEKYPEKAWILATRTDAGARPHDLGLPPFSGWCLRGICHLEAKLGSRFENSAYFK